jgi:hypothetical protein
MAASSVRAWRSRNGQVRGGHAREGEQVKAWRPRPTAQKEAQTLGNDWLITHQALGRPIHNELPRPCDGPIKIDWCLVGEGGGRSEMNRQSKSNGFGEGERQGVHGLPPRLLRAPACLACRVIYLPCVVGACAWRGCGGWCV